MNRHELKEKVKNLRRKGKTYLEINKILNISLPKSTISYWCVDIDLPLGFQRKIRDYNKFHLVKARKIALEKKKVIRKNYFNEINARNGHLRDLLRDKNVAKIALAVLFLGEGFKNPKRGSLAFGNSDSLTISLFLFLLRHCYDIDERKFRCTLQCRADQNIRKLEKFWSKATGIPLAQFYKARIDPRTIGKPSKNLDYKGVCRIDYFSSDIFYEILSIPRIIYKGP